MGYGKEDNRPIIGDGCSWFYRDNDVARTQWTGSITSSGGTWYEQYESSQSFNNEPSDVRMDVTSIVWNWVHGDVPNEGFMVKRSGSIGNTNSNVDEGSTTQLGNFSFFSSDTHTKYPPTLEVEWNDSKWTTGSLSPLSSLTSRIATSGNFLSISASA